LDWVAVATHDSERRQEENKEPRRAKVKKQVHKGRFTSYPFSQISKQKFLCRRQFGTFYS